MLDEFREYEECTCPLDGSVMPRLLPANFAVGDGGLRRALTIVARKELMERGYFDAGQKKQAQILPEVKQVLKEWMGLSKDTDESVSSYDGWLKRYHHTYMESIRDAKPWSKYESNKNNYAGKWFKEAANEENSFHRITYDYVIAEAISYGPLKRYYLVCRKGAGERISKSTDDGKTWTLLKLQNKEDVKLLDHIYKLTAYYLLMRQYTFRGKNRWVWLKYNELVNWAQNYEIYHNTKYFDRISYGKAKIVATRTAKYATVSKKAVNRQFLKKYDFQLLEEGDFSLPPEDYTFFSDPGAGKQLSEKVLYEALDK